MSDTELLIAEQYEMNTDMFTDFGKLTDKNIE